MVNEIKLREMKTFKAKSKDNVVDYVLRLSIYDGGPLTKSKLSQT
jgi:hypothetical protein